MATGKTIKVKPCKISKLMRKILLVLLKAHKEKRKWYEEVTVKELAEKIDGQKTFYGPKHYLDSVRRNSLKRSLRKLIQAGLVEPSIFRMRRGWRGYKLTADGVKKAQQIKDEVIQFAKDYAELI